MSLLEYANHTVPDVVKKSRLSFFSTDPMLDTLQKRNKVKRTGGTHVRLKRIKSGHSDVTQIDASNMSVPLAKKETFSTMTGDWGRLIKPIILPHYDQNRLSGNDQKKAFIRENTDAAMIGLRNDLLRRWYIGNTRSASQLSAIGSLNGGTPAAPNSNGTSSGLTNGALEFGTPAAQASAGNQYLNETRVQDTAADENNYYNQFKAHSGIGTDFLSTCEEIKLLADTYSEMGGIEMVILAIADQVKVADEIRATSGGNNAPLVYTMADWNKGEMHKPIVAAGGMRFHSNRWMSASALGDYSGGSAITEAAYLLNPNFIEYWVNANEDFRVSEFFDGMKHGNQDADIAYIFLEIQLALTSLLAQGCTSQ